MVATTRKNAGWGSDQVQGKGRKRGNGRGKTRGGTQRRTRLHRPCTDAEKGKTGEGFSQGPENQEGAEVPEMPQHQEEGGGPVSTWFAAHIVMYVEFKEQGQEAFPV